MSASWGPSTPESQLAHPGGDPHRHLTAGLSIPFRVRCPLIQSFLEKGCKVLQGPWPQPEPRQGPFFPQTSRGWAIAQARMAFWSVAQVPRQIQPRTPGPTTALQTQCPSDPLPGGDPSEQGPGSTAAGVWRGGPHRSRRLGPPAARGVARVAGWGPGKRCQGLRGGLRTSAMTWLLAAPPPAQYRRPEPRPGLAGGRPSRILACRGPQVWAGKLPQSLGCLCLDVASLVVANLLQIVWESQFN